MNQYFSAGPQTTVMSKVGPNALFYRQVPDLTWALAFNVQSWLDNPYLLMKLGMPKDRDSWVAQTMAYAQTYLGWFPDADSDSTQTPAQLVVASVESMLRLAGNIHADASGERNAGVIADNLGKINFTGSVPDLSGFPLAVDSKPPALVTSDNTAAPKWLSLAGVAPWNWYRAGFAPGFMGLPVYVGGPGLPATWEQYLVQLEAQGVVFNKS